MIIAGTIKKIRKAKTGLFTIDLELILKRCLEKYKNKIEAIINAGFIKICSNI